MEEVIYKHEAEWRVYRTKIIKIDIQWIRTFLRMPMT